MKHPYADVIKAWVDGAPCQWKPSNTAHWMDLYPASCIKDEYRIKPSDTPRDEQTDNHSGICLEVEA